MNRPPMTPDSRLRALLADVGLATIRDLRLANAAAIEVARQGLAARRQAEAFTLLTTKPIAAWTPEDHILFMEAAGEHDQTPAQPTPLPRNGASNFRMGSDPGRTGIHRTIADEIPF